MTSSKSKKDSLPASPLDIKRFFVKPEGLTYRPFHESRDLLKLRELLGAEKTEEKP